MEKNQQTTIPEKSVQHKRKNQSKSFTKRKTNMQQVSGKEISTKSVQRIKFSMRKVPHFN